MNPWFVLILFSPVYIPLVIAFALFLNAEKENKAKRSLALLLLNIAFLFFGLFYFFSGDYTFYSYIIYPNVAALMLVYPGMYIYIKQLIQPRYSKRKIRLHLLPMVFMAVQAAVYYFLLNADEKVRFISEYRYHPTWDNLALNIIFVFRILNLLILFLQIVFYGVKTIVLLRHYHSRILDIFSNTEAVSLNGVRMLNLTLFVGSMASIAFYSINPVKVFGNYVVLIIPLVLISVTLWFLGILGLRQKMLPEEVALIEMKPKEPQLKESLLKEESRVDHALFEKLKTYFETDQPYLNEALKIDDLVQALATNRTHLSNTINQCSGKNFNRFVNDYRVAYAKSYLQEEEVEVSKTTLASVCGFGSVRTFERNFLACTGESFQQYLYSV